MSTNENTRSLKDSNKKPKKAPAENVITDDDNKTRAVDDKLVGDDKVFEEAINPPSDESDKPQDDPGYNAY